MRRYGGQAGGTRTALALVFALTLVAICLPAQALASPPPGGSWISATPMKEPRERAVAAPLPDGNVLVAGGENATGELKTAEIYDPTTNTWAGAAPMNEAREGAVAATLLDGDVLVAGGEGETGRLATAEIYDPSTNTWTAAAPMKEAREGAVAASLPDGEVLVAGGDNALNTSEIYDPTTNEWSSAGSLVQGRDFAAAASLPNGDVLVVGGKESSPFSPFSSSEIYDPSTNIWAETTALSEPRGFPIAAPLPDGDVLVAGGHNGSGYLTSSEAYDPAGRTWTALTPMKETREGAIGASLPNGAVLVAGGENAANEYLASSELFYSAPQAQVAGGDFGDQTVGDPSPVSVLDVTNAGAQVLAITGAKLEGADPGDFAITADSCPGRRLAFEQTCTITARFTPSAPGVREATITLSDNEPTATVIALSGTGVAANAGPVGPQGPAGATGPQGSQGSAGATGVNGLTGATGLSGPAGPRGLQGRTGAQGPAGKVELVTCERVKKGNKITQTCHAKQGVSPIKFTGTGTKLAAVLSRGKLIYATGFAIAAGGERTQLLLTPRRTIGQGSYTLTVKRGHKQHRETITID